MGQTLETVYKDLRTRLQPVTRSPEQAAAEADLLMERALGCTPTDVLTRGYKIVSDSQWRALEDLLYHRVHKRIPIQYLLHRAWFYGLPLYVNPYVLIPRPETELLVDEVLKLAKPGLRVLEIGTGPGSVALALAHKLGDSAHITATDISSEALAVARINQRTLGTHVEFAEGDLFAPLAGQVFDVIVSNPPYVDRALREALDPEVSWHEPEVALFSPTDDACYYYRRLAAEGKAYLTPGGSFLVETGAGMAAEVQAILAAERYTDIHIINDYAGIERILRAVRPA